MTLTLIRTEMRLFLRDKAGPAVGIGLPLTLLIIFGNIPFYNQPKDTFGGLTLLDVYVPILVAFVLATLSLNTLPAVLAAYREQGVLRRLSTTPVGAVRMLAAQLTVMAAVAVGSVTTLLLVARFAFDVTLPSQFGGFLVTVVLAAVALLAIGLFVAAVARTGKAANAIGSALFYPMMFFAGLFLPIAAMPSVLRHIARVTPLGAAVEALSDSVSGHWPHWMQLLTLAAYAIVFSAGAVRTFRWS